MKYDRLVKLVPEGKANAIPGKDLALLFNRSRRDLQELVHCARKDGVLICSDSNGYYLAADPREVLECYRRLRKHSLSQLSAMKVFRQYLKEKQIL